MGAQFRSPVAEIGFQQGHGLAIQLETQVLLVLHLHAIALDDPEGVLAVADLPDRLAEFEIGEVGAAHAANEQYLDRQRGARNSRAVVIAAVGLPGRPRT